MESAAHVQGEKPHYRARTRQKACRAPEETDQIWHQIDCRRSLCFHFIDCPIQRRFVCEIGGFLTFLSVCYLRLHYLFFIFINQIEIYVGFMKSDALQVAKRAQLRTVDAKQTVFRQGFVCLDFFANSFLIHLIPFAKNYQYTECQCSHSNTTCRWNRKRILFCFARICGYPSRDQDSQGMLNTMQNHHCP